MRQENGEPADVLVVDGDAGSVRSVMEALDAAGLRTAAVGDGAAALQRIRRDPPAALVLEVNLPGLSGYEVCRCAREEHGDGLAILFLSGERTESFDRVAGLLIGADDYVTKPFAPDELAARVRAAMRRSSRPLRRRASRLTPREREVLLLLAEGLSQRDISRRLVISPKTVGTHIEHILEKLGVHSRAQAVAAAYRDDLLSASA